MSLLEKVGEMGGFAFFFVPVWSLSLAWLLPSLDLLNEPADFGGRPLCLPDGSHRTWTLRPRIHRLLHRSSDQARRGAGFVSGSESRNSEMENQSEKKRWNLVGYGNHHCGKGKKERRKRKQWTAGSGLKMTTKPVAGGVRLHNYSDDPRQGEKNLTRGVGYDFKMKFHFAPWGRIFFFSFSWARTTAGAQEIPAAHGHENK